MVRNQKIQVHIPIIINYVHWTHLGCSSLSFLICKNRLQMSYRLIHFSTTICEYLVYGDAAVILYCCIISFPGGLHWIYTYL